MPLENMMSQGDLKNTCDSGEQDRHRQCQDGPDRLEENIEQPLANSFNSEAMRGGITKLISSACSKRIGARGDKSSDIGRACRERTQVAVEGKGDSMLLRTKSRFQEVLSNAPSAAAILPASVPGESR